MFSFSNGQLEARFLASQSGIHARTDAMAYLFLSSVWAAGITNSALRGRQGCDLVVPNLCHTLFKLAQCVCVT
jgi:hypothetical protein